MKTQRNILIAFLLNLGFSIFEFIGGMLAGSVAIVSDAIHDVGDTASIGIAYFLERKSKKQPDATHTYGYARYSVIGGLITTVILLVGSIIVIYNAVDRIFAPTVIHYDAMIVFAVVGVCVNFLAVFFTRDGDSVNQKAVNLHMLEDVLGWAVVLVGAVVMRFTDFALLDPIMSIGVAAFVFITAVGNLKEITDLFLEKTPHGVDVADIKAHILHIDGVRDVHDIHIWSMDGQRNYATLHIVIDGNAGEIKGKVREELMEHSIGHVTIETETEDEPCLEKACHAEQCEPISHHHHHHHHHHGRKL